MQLVTPRLLLREFRETDAEALYDFEHRLDFQRYENDPPPTLDQIRAHLPFLIRAVQENPRSQYRLIVTIPPDDIAIGRVKLSLNLREINEWAIGWGIHPDLWGQGYATEAARAMLDFGFRELKAHRITAMCHTENAASIRVMEKLGMQREAHLRSTFWLHGAWCDEYVYGILDREYHL